MNNQQEELELDCQWMTRDQLLYCLEKLGIIEVSLLNLGRYRILKSPIGLIKADPKIRDRIAALYRRKPSTAWSGKELTALRLISPVAEDDLAVVERFYESERKKKDNYCRRDLYTFLNNFPGEVDRARTWEEKHNRPYRSLI